MRIILASVSPRRKQVMEGLGLPYMVKPSGFDERSINIKDPAKLVERLALEKARTVAKENPDALVIGADTLAMIGEKIVGKPKDLGEARRFLLMAAGKEIKDFNGVAVIYQGKEKSASVTGFAKMKKFGDREISDYFSRIDPLDKTGGFAADPAGGGEFMESYKGEPGQELGLPLDTLKKLLSTFGVRV